MIFTAYSGIRIPTEALRSGYVTQDSEGNLVSQEGLGVYCVVGMKARFKPVELVHQGRGVCFGHKRRDLVGKPASAAGRYSHRGGGESIRRKSFKLEKEVGKSMSIAEYCAGAAEIARVCREVGVTPREITLVGASAEMVQYRCTATRQAGGGRNPGSVTAGAAGQDRRPPPGPGCRTA